MRLHFNGDTRVAQAEKDIYLIAGREAVFYDRIDYMLRDSHCLRMCGDVRFQRDVRCTLAAGAKRRGVANQPFRAAVTDGCGTKVRQYGVLPRIGVNLREHRVDNLPSCSFVGAGQDSGVDYLVNKSAAGQLVFLIDHERLQWRNVLTALCAQREERKLPYRGREPS